MDLPIRTPRLLLRPWAPDDLDAFHAIWGDARVITWGPSPDRAASERLLHARAIAGGWLAIVHDGVIVGNVFLQAAPTHPGEVELGYHLARHAWGRGYATEAASALLDRGPDAVLAYVLLANDRSHAVLGRLGFVDHGPITHGGLPHRLYRWHRSGRPPA